MVGSFRLVAKSRQCSWAPRVHAHAPSQNRGRREHELQAQGLYTPKRPEVSDDLRRQRRAKRDAYHPATLDRRLYHPPLPSSHWPQPPAVHRWPGAPIESANLGVAPSHPPSPAVKFPSADSCACLNISAQTRTTTAAGLSASRSRGSGPGSDAEPLKRGLGVGAKAADTGGAETKMHAMGWRLIIESRSVIDSSDCINYLLISAREMSLGVGSDRAVETVTLFADLGTLRCARDVARRHEPDAIRVPPEENTIDQTLEEEPSDRFMVGTYVSAFQTRIVRLPQPETMRMPSSKNAKEKTMDVAPEWASDKCAVRAEYGRTVLCLPNTDSAISGTRGNTYAIRRKGDRKHDASMTLEWAGGENLTTDISCTDWPQGYITCIQNPGRAIAIHGTRDNACAARREHQRANVAGMAPKWVNNERTISRTPDAYVTDRTGTPIDQVASNAVPLRTCHVCGHRHMLHIKAQHISNGTLTPPPSPRSKATMEPEQPDSSTPQPQRRWYEDLSRKLKQKISKSSRSGSKSRPPTPLSGCPSNSESHDTAWRMLEATLHGLQESVELPPPLRPAIDGLASFLNSFKAATKHHQYYQHMRSNLNNTLQSLKQHLADSTSIEITEVITDILRAIQEEVGITESQQIGSMSSRVLTGTLGEEDLARKCRRIGQLFYRLQLEISMGGWHTENAAQTRTRLEKLRPARLAAYDSELSVEANRRTYTENTRKNILHNLNMWSSDPFAEKVFWMDGMAGTGKTTIAWTLCQVLQSRGQLAASFFCTRTSPECRDGNRIVPTIAYQLGHHSTPFLSALDQAIDASPSNLSAQFEQLLMYPLLEVKHKLPNNLVVVIDALDECEDDRTVTQILDLLFQFIWNLPVKFFITSRPDAAIHEKMISPENTSKSTFHLHDIEQSLVQEDVELYLQNELRFMSPSPSDLKRLATLADNLFIYAATVVRYIRLGKTDSNPHSRLATILSVDSESRKKLAQIDSLYTTILGGVLGEEELEPMKREVMERVLWAVVCAKEPIPVEILASLAGLSDKSQAEVALEPFRSVLHVSEHTEFVSTIHRSFPDYMFTRDRSGKFCCDVGTHSQLLARRCLEVMKEQLRFNICNLPSSFIPDADVPDLQARINANISPSLWYACRYWTGHLKLAAGSDGLREMVDEFLSQRLLFWMEVLNLKGRMILGAQGLMAVQAWLKTTDGSLDSAKLASDAHQFVARFASHSITRSTPHIYISALPLCPSDSPVSLHYRQRMQGLMEVEGAAIVRLGQVALATWTTKSSIACVTYSPDGTHVVSGDGDGMISVRNVYNGKVVVGPFKAHSSDVTSTIYSPDGNRIASGSKDNTIRLWDARDGTLVSSFDTYWVNSVAFSPDGNRIVSGSNNRTILVWDARNGTVAAGPFKGHIGRVKSVGYSPDGRCVVSGSGDRTIRTWDVNTGCLIHLFQGHTDVVNSVGFSADGKHIVSGSDDCTIRVWNVRDGTLPIGPLKGHTKSVLSVAFSPNSALIVSGSGDQTIRVWSAHDGTLAAGPFEEHTGIVASVGFSPDGSQIVSGSNHRGISIWNVFDSALTITPSKGHSWSVYSAEFSPDGLLIATGSYDNTIRVWSAVDGSYVAGPFEGHTSWVNSVAFSPDSTRIASGSYDQTIRVWHARNGALLARPIKGHSDSIKSVAFSPNGSRIASGSSDKTIRVWDSSNGRLVAGPFKGHTKLVHSVAFSPDGAYIASGSQDGTIRIWNSFTGNQIANPVKGHTGGVNSVCFSHDGSHIVFGSLDHVYILSVPNGQLIAGPFRGHINYVFSVAVSPDGTLVVSGSQDHTIRLWNADGTLAAPPLRGHTDVVSAVSFSPDGSSILSCSYDQSIRVWDIHQKQRTPAALTDVWEICDDGWVLNTHSQMLFWLPVEIRSYFPRPNNRFMIGPAGSVQAEFDDMLLGEEWAKCWLDV
ncbi:Vegetative incompatibility protein HET-E-1 [Ceratobasidium theobromae]|uniref:Vegetative incompatibility protein HET-E-1 n=1 Tax=Ceratobasidium theobromae TaxID=1582974 RepID=A0A5N5QG21_9AGAM|nr:Vegetative incompatibility protein HET-E-1 [Ceratobasidium theobromae]